MKFYDIEITDWIQAGAAIIAAIGTVWALIKLVVRDKDRESEIASLSAIASQLTSMLKVSEARHKDSKKPQVAIKFADHYPLRTLRLDFINNNSNTSIVDYRIEIETENESEVSSKKHSVTDDNGKQTFYLELDYVREFPAWIVVVIDYETEERFVFTQEIFIWHITDKRKFNMSPNIIFDKERLLSTLPK